MQRERDRDRDKEIERHRERESERVDEKEGQRESDRESKQWKMFSLLKSDQVTSKANTRDLSTKKSGNRRGTKEKEIRNF